MGDKSNRLKYNRIIITTHVYATGPAQDLKEYLLLRKVGNLLFIGHPLFYKETLHGSGFEKYRSGKLKAKRYFKIRKIPPLVGYFQDAFLNVLFVLFTFRKWDLYVGSDNLNAFSGIILRKLGLVKRVIYYVIDYNPYRFKSRALNMVYHRIDQFCVKQADETWNLSPRMEEGRKEYFNFEGGNQKVVPVGVWYDRYPRKSFDEIDHHRVVYMGHILKKQGIQHVISAIPEIVKEIPDFTFLIIGDGKYLPELKKLARGLKVSSYIKFKGYVEDHREVEKLISGCALGVALYDKYDEFGNLSYTYFADPMKIKVYLAAGVPVMTTDVPYTSNLIQTHKLGLVIKDMSKIEGSLKTLLDDPNTVRLMRKNVLNYPEYINNFEIYDSLFL